MTTSAFGKVFGVTHAAVIKWEGGQLPAPPMDLYIRMYALNGLKAKNEDFGKLFHEVSMTELVQAKRAFLSLFFKFERKQQTFLLP